MAYAPRILIVEDDPGVRRLFEQVLADDGYYVQSVARGRHALHVLQEVNFDLVIVDMSLPDVDGPEVIREIAAEYPHVIVFASSGAMESHMQTLARSAGASLVFRKPILAGELRNLVYAALDPTYSWRGTGAG